MLSLHQLQAVRKAIITLSQVLLKRGEYIRRRHLFPSGDIIEVMLMLLPMTPLDGGLAGDDDSRHGQQLHSVILIAATHHLLIHEGAHILPTCSQEQDW